MARSDNSEERFIRLCADGASELFETLGPRHEWGKEI